LPNLSEETFLLPDGFLTELDPQIRLLTLPNFGVNSAMPQKPWAVKNWLLMFLLDRLPLCQFSSSSLEVNEE
jgi:hypothetical protein